MGFRILADEHCEQQVVAYLRDDGHDVERVVEVPELGPGSDDVDIADYAQRTDRLVLTGDTDFLAEFDASDHAGVLFQPETRTDPHRVAGIVSAIANHRRQDAIDGAVYVVDSWP